MRNFLKSSSSDLLETLNQFGHKKTYHQNEIIFSEGDKALFLPIILSGKLKMVRFPEVGKEVIIGVFQTGEVFAIPPVFDGKNYPSTAIAMTKTELLLLKRTDFLQLLKDSSEFSFSVIGWMCEMLREKTATINNLATASPAHRIGNILLHIAETEKDNIENVELPIKISLRRQDIAEMAGLTTETTIRAVRKLADKNLLEIIQGKIVLSEIQSLRDFLR